jgi:broad specificity phosphatase PhoE
LTEGPLFEVKVPVTRFILIRHGQSEGNRDKRFPSHLAPLTELGRNQAQAVAQWIEQRYRPHLVVVSPFTRTYQTGAIIAAHFGIEMTVEPAIREQHMGILIGQTWESVRNDPTWDRNRFWLWRPAGGENYEEVRIRAGRALDRMAELQHGRDVIVVSHGGVISALCAHVGGTWGGVRVPRNGGIVIAEHAEGRYMPPIIPEQLSPV